MNKKENEREIIVCVRNDNKSQPFWQNKICSPTLLISHLGSSKRVNKYILFIFSNPFTADALNKSHAPKNLRCKLQLGAMTAFWCICLLPDNNANYNCNPKIKRRKTQIKRLIKGAYTVKSGYKLATQVKEKNEARNPV